MRIEEIIYENIDEQGRRIIDGKPCGAVETKPLIRITCNDQDGYHILIGAGREPDGTVRVLRATFESREEMDEFLASPGFGTMYHDPLGEIMVTDGPVIPVESIGSGVFLHGGVPYICPLNADGTPALTVGECCEYEARSYQEYVELNEEQLAELESALASLKG